MKKTFDSVELQHRGAEKVQARLASMTIDEQVEYWERREREIRERKASASARRKVS